MGNNQTTFRGRVESGYLIDRCVFVDYLSKRTELFQIFDVIRGAGGFMLPELVFSLATAFASVSGAQLSKFRLPTGEGKRKKKFFW